MAKRVRRSTWVWIAVDKGNHLLRWPWRRVRRHHKRPPLPPVPEPTPQPVVNPAKPILMYDSVSVDQIPRNAKAVAGYVGGHWVTYPVLVKEFPKAHKLSIAIAASEDADALDIERGDAEISEAAAWVKRQQKRGLRKPVVYTSLSQAQPLLNSLYRAGVKRSDVRLWTAHYTGKRHLCGSSCGFGLTTTADATQFYNRALGRNLDVSLCKPSFFGSSTPV